MDKQIVAQDICKQLFQYACKHKLVWETINDVKVVSRSEKDLDNPTEQMVYYVYHYPNLFQLYRTFHNNIKP